MTDRVEPLLRCQACGGVMVCDGAGWIHRDWVQPDWDIEDDWGDECLTGQSEWDGTDGRLPVEIMEDV